MLPLILLLKSKLKSHSLNKNYRLPPGPWTFPIIGSIHHLIGRGLPPQALDSLSRQYGGLMFLQLGELPTIVVSSREAAREIMKTHDLKFCTRPVNPAMKILTYDGKDIVAAPYGKYWREVRKISVLELFSTKRVQSFRSIREEEIKNLIEQISLVSVTRQFFNLSAMLLSFVNDVVLQALMGSKANEQNLLITEVRNFAEIIADFNIGNMFPSSRLASMLSSTVHRAKQFRINIDRLFDDIIEEHRNKEGAGGAEDLLSVLLRLHDEDSDNNNFSMENVKALIIVSHIALIIFLSFQSLIH
jgi:cytochrome P450